MTGNNTVLEKEALVVMLNCTKCAFCDFVSI